MVQRQPAPIYCFGFFVLVHQCHGPAYNQVLLFLFAERVIEE
jgi:hypothetical protein